MTPVCLALFLCACTSRPQRAPAIGEAYAGPATLNLRQEIAPRSAVVATVRHGERLEIIQQRRRFYKVRAAGGGEGWTDERMLLSPQEVAKLRKLGQQAKLWPSQGVATTFDLLNAHTEPHRESPSFFQIKAGEKVDVLDRRVTLRAAPPSKRLVVTQAAQPALRRKEKERKKATAIPPPPMPPAPKPPDDWLAHSKSPVATSLTAKPEPTDDWTLVRNASGGAGWVLTRRLYMAIPDEVAQYAEGRRIASYFALGQVRDKKQEKTTWLWTTMEQSLAPYDFDSLRVFVWSLGRHRYETAYIERNLKGYYPVLLHPVELTKSLRGRAPAGTKVSGFSVLVEKKDGKRYRRNYAYWDQRVRFAGEVPAPDAPRDLDVEADPGLVAAVRREQAPAPDSSFYGRVKQSVKRLFGR